MRTLCRSYHLTIFAILALVLFPSACAKQGASAGVVTSSASSSTPATAAGDRSAIAHLLYEEAQGVLSQDIDSLMNLWAEDATVIDAKHTPNLSSDDARWRGRDAIRERYVMLVFPGAATAVKHPIVDLVLSSGSAVVTTTTEIGGETAVGGDRWTFRKQDGNWWITGLTYNMEP